MIFCNNKFRTTGLILYLYIRVYQGRRDLDLLLDFDEDGIGALSRFA